MGIAHAAFGQLGPRNAAFGRLGTWNAAFGRRFAFPGHFRVTARAIQ